MKYRVENTYYGESEDFDTIDEARAAAKDWADDSAACYGAERTEEYPITLSLVVPIEEYKVVEVKPEVVCTCATVRTCVVAR